MSPREQPDVLALFDASSDYWRDVYDEAGLQGVIYRERQAAVVALAERVEDLGPARVLEVGCGAGALTVELARRAHAVEAIDLSTSMVEKTAARVEASGLAARVRVRAADVHDLALPAASVDLVVGVGILPWLDDPEAAVAAMARPLAPGGHLILTADNRARLTTFTDPRSNPALAPLRRARRRVAGPQPVRLSHKYLPSTVDRMLASAGLRVVTRRSVGFGPLTFWDRPLLGDRRATALHRSLQRLADRGVPGLRLTGWHYVVAARRLDDEGSPGGI